VAPTDHVALTDHVAPDDHVAPNDHVAPADHVALTDHVAPNDHVAPTDHVALTDHVAPDDDVAAKGKRRKRPKPTANTHGMQTRFKAKTVAAVTFAVIVWFQSVLAQECQIDCAPEGISVTTSERVVYALWCCERYSCQLIKGDTKGVFQLPMNVTGQQYGCNMACRGMVDIDPVQVVCSPWLPTEWPSWLRPTAISLLLLIIGILLGWKGGATWRAITNCCRRARLRLRAHQEDDEEGQELQLRENGPRVRFRPEETDGSIDKTRKDKTRKDTKGQTRKDAPEAAFVMTVPRRRESRQPPHIARWQKRQLVLRW
jgi:hypothetical protein